MDVVNISCHIAFRHMRYYLDSILVLDGVVVARFASNHTKVLNSSSCVQLLSLVYWVIEVVIVMYTVTPLLF